MGKIEVVKSSGLMAVRIKSDNAFWGCHELDGAYS